ncbi:MAG TPA: hypothetical protein V6D22_08745 [Candidatus Obscuribacterales bacterium]
MFMRRQTGVFWEKSICENAGIPMPLVAEIYILCAVGGAFVLVISALMGFVGHAHVGHGGHGGAGHAGLGHSTGGHGAVGHGAGHAAAGHGAIGHAGGHTAAHGAAGHAGAHGSAGHASSHAAPAHGTSGHAAGAHGSGQASAAHSGAGTEPELMSLATAHVHPHGKNQDRIIVLITLFNPSTVAAFAAWFGACGLFAWRLFPALPVEYTLVIAVVAGLLGTKFILHMMSTMSSRMYSSASFSKDSLIGYEAEVTVSLQAGRTGEIACIARGPSYTISARCLLPEGSFKRGDRVIISDIRDDIAYVERWPEDVLPLDDEAVDDATLDSSQSRKQPQTPNP